MHTSLRQHRVNTFSLVWCGLGLMSDYSSITHTMVYPGSPCILEDKEIWCHFSLVYRGRIPWNGWHIKRIVVVSRDTSRNGYYMQCADSAKLRQLFSYQPGSEPNSSRSYQRLSFHSWLKSFEVQILQNMYRLNLNLQTSWQKLWVVVSLRRFY